MKKSRDLCGRFARRVLLASVLAVLAVSSTASAQLKQGPFITQASERLTKLINKANTDGFTLQPDKLTIGGGWLKQGADKWVVLYTINLQKGKKYRFLAAGDEDARDVDLQVLDPGGSVVASDTKRDPEAVVNFQPAESGQYRVRVRLFESRNNLDCVCLAITMVLKK